MSSRRESLLPESVELALTEARPEPPGGLERRLGLGNVLAAIMGGSREPPRIGRFPLSRKVGAGGMGVVYRSHDPDTGSPVAIKVLDGKAMGDRARFVREASAMQAIVHPNVVRYLEHGTTSDGLDFLVMEWLEGRDLGARLRFGPLPVRDALRLALAAAQGLAGVHLAGLVHRDVKPSNLFLIADRVDDVRVMDFGIARAVAPGTRLTVTGAVLGTPQYMAPEQLRGESDFRTDVYGLGATLFECLTGRPPHLGDNPGAVLLAVLAGPVASAADLCPEVTPALDALLGRMLAKDPAERPADMAAVIAELAQHLADLDGAHRLRPALSRAERPPSSASVRALTSPGAQALVGRAQELAQLSGALAQSEEEELATLVLVSGEAGVGKSAVLRALLHDARRRRPAWTCLHAEARRDASGVPFSTLRSLIESEASAPRAHLLALLDSLAARHVGSEGERVALEPLLLADRLILAWLELLEAWSDAGPLLVAVDDADAADLASLRFLERALQHLGERTFVVVLAGRVEPAGFGGGSGHVRSQIRLGPLRARSAEALAARWAPSKASSEAARAAELSQGNPGHLRELIRELNGGFGLAAGSLAQLAWTRLERLMPEDRRVLRAASIVGRTFWVGAVAQLLGVEAGDPELSRRLALLVSDGYLAPSDAPGGGAPLQFASELMHVTVYESCTEDDLQRGHQAMTRWFAEDPVYDPAAFARHLRGAGDHQAASEHYLAAAHAALAAGNREQLDECLTSAAEGATPTASGQIAALRAQADFWQGATGRALEAALVALSQLRRGSEPWAHAASVATTAAGQLGDNGQVSRLSLELFETAPLDAAAANRRFAGMCRAVAQLRTVGLPADPRVEQEIAQAEPAGLSPEARAWLYRARAAAVAVRHFDQGIEASVRAHRAFLEAQDARSAAVIELYLTSYYVFTGNWERARETVDDAMGLSRRLGADYLVLWARYSEAKLLTEVASAAEALAALDAVAEAARQSPRMRAGALVYGSLVALRAGQLAAAAARAEEARAAHQSPDVSAGALAAWVRCLVRQGRLDEAAALREALSEAGHREAPSYEFDTVLRLARAELALALGDPEAAREALADAAAAIERRAATLADPLRRNHYLTRPYLVSETLRLVAEQAI